MSERNAKARLKRAEVECEIAQTVSRFTKDSFGRGPLRVRAHWVDDAVLVRCCGPLTAFDQRLADGTGSARAYELARQLRHELVELGRESLEADIGRLTGRKVLAVLSDVSMPHAESVLVFLLDEPHV